MDVLKNEDLAIDLKIMKLCFFYHMFNPNMKTVFGYNVFRLLYIIFTVISQCLVLYGVLGYFFIMDDSINEVDFFVSLLILSHNYHCLLRLSFLCLKPKAIWNVVDVSRFNFFTSKLCCENVKILHENGKKTRKINNFYFFFTLVAGGQWIIVPLVLYLFKTSSNTSHRFQNILNLSFPVTTRTYNNHYVVFYLIEMVIALCMMSVLLMVESTLISFCRVIIGQYEVLAKAFEDVGANNLQTQKEHYDDFKSILFDLQKLDLKIKSYYSVVQPIILMYVAFSSCLFVTVTYALILLCSTSGPFPIFEVLKLGSSIILVSSQLCVCCYLFGEINIKREWVNFGIYSCNWTKMDLQFKKLLLLSMRMNDANKSMMKASPKRVINLQLYANVIMTSYNIVSVMLKTMRKNKI